MSETNVEKKHLSLLKYFGIAGTIISVLAGIIGLYKQIKPEDSYPNLDGVWIITHTVEQSRKTDFIGENYVYKVSVQQIENLISGKGEQTLYNGKPAKKHFKMEWEQVIAKETEMKITFTLGADRTINGNMTLNVDPDNPKHYTGVYYSPIADSKGKVDVLIE